MFVGFPSDIQPRPGQNWENSNVTLAKDWLKSHLVGDRISIRATFEEANLTEAFARLKADVESCDSSIGKIGNKIADPHLPWKNGIHAKCPPSQFKSIAKLAKGDPVQLSGVITDLEFHAYNNVVAGNKKITMFHLVLEVEDCSIGH
jgi:hypothetical protein